VSTETTGRSAEEGTTEATLPGWSVGVDRTSGVLPVRRGAVLGLTVRRLTVRSLSAVRVVVLGLVRVVVAGSRGVPRWWGGGVLAMRGR